MVIVSAQWKIDTNHLPAICGMVSTQRLSFTFLLNEQRYIHLQFENVLRDLFEMVCNSLTLRIHAAK